MPDSISDKIINSLTSLSQNYHRLLLLTGKAGSGKTEILKDVSMRLRLHVLNLNKELSHRMLQLTERQRPLKASKIVKEIINSKSQDVLLIDNIELLFDVSLKIDPMHLLKGMSRNKTLIISWSGQVDNGAVIYAESNHPEYKKYPIDNFNVISV